MTGVLKDLPFAMAYLDDIIIYSSTPEEHLEHIRTVFEKLRDAKLSMKLSKCHFFAKEIQYLAGHIPNKSADTITKAFIRHYLPRHMCPQFILSDNGTEFKNQIFDKVTKDLGIERIFSAPYHPQSNGKLETFHKFLKPTLKKMFAEDQDNWDDYIEQVLGTYRGVPNLMTGELPFFLVYGRDGNQPVHQLLQPLTRFLGDPDSGLLCLDQH